MSKDYIIAPNHIRYELEEAERAVVAVNGILEDVIDPTFKGCTCGGLLDAWSEETNGDRGAAALKWMEQNFDAIKMRYYQNCQFPQMMSAPFYYIINLMIAMLI